MPITEILERNARLYGQESALVELNPSEERDVATTWREFKLIESAADAPYRRELSWKDFDRKANRFANLLLSRGFQKGTKVALLLMNCLEWLPLYFGISVERSAFFGAAPSPDASLFGDTSASFLFTSVDPGADEA